MKIRWMLEQREVPGIGLLKAGQVIDVPENIAKSLIDQKHAKAVLTGKTKKKNTTDKKE